MGGSVIDDNLIDGHSGPRRSDLLSPGGAADGDDHDYDPGEADGRQHQKPPLVVARFSDRRTTRGFVRMPTLTPDASSACPRIVGLKSQRSRRANLRRIQRFAGSRDYLTAARGPFP